MSIGMMSSATNRRAIALAAVLFAAGAFASTGWSNPVSVAGVGWEGQGAGIALYNLDTNPRPHLILMAYDNPSGANTFRYKIGWNVTTAGVPASWSAVVQVPGVGWEGQGAGIALRDLDGNGRPEMILMAYDNPSGANEFRYKIGWNVNTAGVAASWSGITVVPGVGWEGQGAKVAFVNLDANPRPEMVLLAYDNPSGANTFRYKIGWNVSTAGAAASWSGTFEIPGVGWEGQGAGLAFHDFDGNGRPEMVLMAYDNPSGANTFRYKIGWNVAASGAAASWGGVVQAPGVGWEGQGADLAISDLDGNGRPELILMAYDNPSGGNTFRYRIGWDMQVVKDFAVALSTLGFTGYLGPTQIPSSLATQTAPNLYQLSDPVVDATAWDALSEYVNDCRANPGAHWTEVAPPGTPQLAAENIARNLTLLQAYQDPDVVVAAIAWFVDQNMDWTDDGTNQRILNGNYGLNYNPGWDFPVPANFTITYTGDAAFGTLARFHGDCEDHAILRAALLRKLGFNPRFVWNVMDNPVTHEYNVVAYRGRLRLMDYGPIGSWLATHTWSSHQSYYGYSEAYGPRGTGSSQHTVLASWGNNYPDAPLCRTWDYHNYYADTCP